MVSSNKKRKQVSGIGDRTNKGFWQRTARLYTPFMNGNKQLYEEISALIRPHLSGETRMLELATGPGILALSLAHTGAKITATDYAENMIAQAKRKAHPSNLTFEVADATALPYPDRRFDVVLIANALHVMPEPDMALAEIHRVLKDGGLLIAPTFLHSENRSVRMRTRLLELIGFRTYHKWNSAQLGAYISARRFTIQKRSTIRGGMEPLCYIEAKKQQGVLPTSQI